MYHYRISGLPNIWLANGFEWRDTAYGKAISFQDVDGLHAAIGRTLLGKGELTGREFRFLRVELDLSQAELGKMFGKSDQAVALWEKGRGAPQWAQRILLGLYRERMGRAVRLSELFLKPDSRANGRKALGAAKPARLIVEARIVARDRSADAGGGVRRQNPRLIEEPTCALRAASFRNHVSRRRILSR